MSYECNIMTNITKYASVETTSDFDFILVNYFFKSVNKFAFIYYLYFCTLNRMNSLALTGTLSTIPSEISLGYVIAMPKFTRILNAVKEKNAQ